ncbi:NUDIX hydrolase [Nonomuraea sp. B1E8]|uniref:NUDIX hydrolase n=1 Tax=unclassified Nonomuraea TaxID=2593643 RepID=UPI00325D6CCD
MSQPYGCAITAHLLAADKAGRLLILRTATNHGRWQLPGGRAHAGESPRTAAAREAREEIGLDLPAGELLVSAWTPGSQGRRDRFALLFSTRQLTSADLGAITLQANEVDAWSMVESAEVRNLVHPLMAERLAALPAFGRGRYIEHGPAEGTRRSLLVAEHDDAPPPGDG